MTYLGDYAPGDVIDYKFTTRQFSTGQPFTLGGSPAPLVYKANDTGQSAAGVALTVDFDGVTGLNHVRIQTAADAVFYADGSQYDIIISAGTVDGVSIEGEVIGRFTLRAQASLYPTVATRKLDVSAAGNAGIDWSNIEAPTTAQALTQTSILTATAVETDTQDIQTRLPAALSGGRMVALADALSNNVITTASIADGALTAAKAAAGFFDAVWSVTTRTLSAGAITAATFAANALDAVWATTTRLLTAGTNIVLAKGTGITGFNDLSAGDVRTAVGLGSANLDTQLAAINSNVSSVGGAVVSLNNLSQADVRTAVGLASANLDTQLSAINSNVTAVGNAVAALNNLSSAQVAAAVQTLVIEGTLTHQQVMRVLLAAAAGLSPAPAAGTRAYRDQANTKDRILASVSGGNRTSMVLDVT